MDITTTPKGLIPVNWMHADFTPVMQVRRLLMSSLDAMWDTDDPVPAMAFLVEADKVARTIQSESIRASWLAVIEDDERSLEDLFDL